MKFIKLNKELSLSPLKESDFPIFINRINDYNVYRYTVNIPYPYALQNAYEALKYFAKRSKKFGRETSWSIRMNSEVIGGFANVGYWSSTEGGNYYAWMQNFFNGFQYFNSSKGNDYDVRAVRAF